MSGETRTQCSTNCKTPSSSWLTFSDCPLVLRAAGQSCIALKDKKMLCRQEVFQLNPRFKKEARWWRWKFNKFDNFKPTDLRCIFSLFLLLTTHSLILYQWRSRQFALHVWHNFCHYQFTVFHMSPALCKATTVALFGWLTMGSNSEVLSEVCTAKLLWVLVMTSSSFTMFFFSFTFWSWSQKALYLFPSCHCK